MTGEPAFRRLVPLGGMAAASVVGAKGARLSAALRAALPVLPGWVVPCAQARAGTRAAASAVRRGDPAAARRAVLSRPIDSVLGTELAAAAGMLGGRVIVRSSSPLERDPRWSGAFSSIAEVGPGDVATAVRSCWAAAFAVDPLARLQATGLGPEALELAVVIQPELCPQAGGTARVVTSPHADAGDGRGADVVVDVEGVPGHPGPLLAGWADGASARLTVPASPARPGLARPAVRSDLAELIGGQLTCAVAALAVRVHRLLGDDTIEWAIQDGKVWLLQSQASGPANAWPPGAVSADTAGDLGVLGASAAQGTAGSASGQDGTDGLREHLDCLAGRNQMPLLAAAVRARGQCLRGRPAAAGTAAGRLVPCQPHQRAAASCLDAILLVDRPVPALAPLLFGARGLIARSGAASVHLAEVARSLAVPMVTGCRLPPGIGADPSIPPRISWLAAIDGTTGEIALLPG